MIKVLIGNQNIQKDINDFKFLNNDNDCQIITSTSGVEVISKCQKLEPNIIILNSNLSDMRYTEVIDKISVLPSEINKCNLLLKVNNSKEKLLLSNTAIIYKIFDNNDDENKYKDTINTLKEIYEVPEITLKDIKFILLNFGMNTYNNATKYLMAVILQCYYHPEYLITLNNIYEIIAKQYKIPREQIKNSIRHLIDVFNNSYDLINQNLYKSIFKVKDELSPKRFIEMLVIYLQIIKNK